MALGDNDIAKGLFFSDWDTVVFNGTEVKGLFDAPGADGMFSKVSVSDADYSLKLSASAFSPMPIVTSRLTVCGNGYQVREVNPLDDGKIVQLKLRKL